MEHGDGPRVSELTRMAMRLYEAGDFAAARALARAIHRRGDEFSDEDRRVANTILERTGLDRRVVWTGVVVLLVVIAVFVWAVAVSH